MCQQSRNIEKVTCPPFRPTLWSGIIGVIDDLPDKAHAELDNTLHTEMGEDNADVSTVAECSSSGVQTTTDLPRLEWYR